MSRTLAGAVALVTGASSGIGEATAKALAEQGATVAVFARRGDRLAALAGEDDALRPYQVDVTDPDAVRTAIDRVADELGGIDVLVNNAGYGAYAPALGVELDQWRRMVDVNVNGVLATTHAALPHLTAAARGPRGIADVVTISSVAGRKVANGMVNVYAATKHAVGAFSEALRQELTEAHVRVGLVEPGMVVTEMTTGGERDSRELGEFGALRPEDIADAVLYMVTRPARTAINEMLVRPIEQAR